MTTPATAPAACRTALASSPILRVPTLARRRDKVVAVGALLLVAGYCAMRRLMIPPAPGGLLWTADDLQRVCEDDATKVLCFDNNNATAHHQATCHSPIGAAAAYDFHEQGFMKVGQLVPPAAIRALREAALGMSPVAAPIYGMLTGYKTWELTPWLRRPEFWAMASRGPTAGIVSKLFGGKPVRLLHDGFIGAPYSTTPITSGWHFGTFSLVQNDTDAITVWIPLQALSSGTGGGLALADKRRVSADCAAHWVEKEMAHHLGARRAAECVQELTDMKQVHDLAVGDALVFDKWTFHNPEPLRDGTLEGNMRWAYIMRFVPADVKYAVDPQAVKTKWLIYQYLVGAWSTFCEHGLKKGDVLNSTCFPEVYPRSATSDHARVERGGTAGFRFTSLSSSWIMGEMLKYILGITV